MPIKFNPNFTISGTIAQNLLRIEATRVNVLNLPITAKILRSLRESARLYTTHYSTMIEGNQLTPDQIQVILADKGHFPGRKRDEDEVMGYYAALTFVEKFAASNKSISQIVVQEIHALVMGHGKKKMTPTTYRDGQNVIRNGSSGAIVYMPPQAHDVPDLMAAMIAWADTMQYTLPCPVVAAIIHYQFATIHPYYDGNGRTARLLTTLILHRGGYDLKGLYSLEEYYAQNLPGYYQAISVGTSHNYYMGREQADISQWIEYFIAGMAVSFENVCKRLQSQPNHAVDQNHDLKNLNPRQRKALQLFVTSNVITSRDIAQLFECQPRTSAKICADWVKDGFFEIVDSSNKARSYKLAQQYEKLVA